MPLTGFCLRREHAPAAVKSVHLPHRPDGLYQPRRELVYRSTKGVQLLLGNRVTTESSSMNTLDPVPTGDNNN
jgi:hypothetical protein